MRGMMLVILFLIVGLAWGTATCVGHLDRALGDAAAVRAVAFERLDAGRVALYILNTRLVLAVPENPRPEWRTLPGTGEQDESAVQLYRRR
ncbi:MAG: hypothetical protein ACOYU7_02205 [Bacillota bacterium]